MFARHFFIDSPERLKTVAATILRELPFSKTKPLEIVVRPLGKTDRDRRRFHFICGEAAPQLALTPNETKQLIKSEFYGVETRSIGGKSYQFLQSSEESDREEYARLIAFALQFLAEQGIVIQFRPST